MAVSVGAGVVVVEVRVGVDGGVGAVAGGAVFAVVTQDFCGVHGGLLSWSKVRALTRVATAANESKLLTVALFGTANHVDRLVRAVKQVSAADAVKQLAERGFRWSTDGDGSVVLTVRLPADQAMQVIGVVREATVITKGVPRCCRSRCLQMSRL